VPHIKKLREAATAWAAQEQANIDAGVKKPPVSRLEQFMVERNKPLKTALIREVEPGRSRLMEAAKRKHRYPSGTRVMSPGLTVEEASASLPPHPEAPRKRGGGWNRGALKEMRMQSAAETGEAQAFVGQIKPGIDKRTQQHHLQSREFTKTQEVPGAGRKDLGRSTLNVIKSESGKSGGGSLMALAKKRQAKGHSIAGKPGNLDGSRNSLSNRLKGIGGKLGGKLGMYGIAKSVIEGASTLRKLKSGAYTLTPEGTAKPKKGVVES